MTSLLRTPRARAVGCALLLFGLALALRLAGLTWGLPTAERWYPLHPDERQVAVAAASLDFLGGDFNPDFYNYPSLFIYLSYMLHGAAALLGLFAPQESWQLLRDFILSGRVVSALLGAATAPAVWLLARAVFPQRPRAAFAAGLAAALAPGLVQHSHFATVDAAATFFVALCLMLAARAPQSARGARLLCLAAVCAGLAAATKYNTGLVLVAPLCAAWQMRGAAPGRALWLKLPLAAGAGFLIGCPGALLYFRDFWGDPRSYNGFSYELFTHPREGSGEIFQQTGNGWWYHGAFNLPFAFTAPALLAALVGLALACRQKNARLAPGILFAALFFLSLGLSNVRFMRYVFPLLPVLCLGIGALAFLPRRVNYAVAAGCLAVLALGTVNVLEPLLQADTRDVAAEWIRNNAPEGARIGITDRPWFWTPPVSPLDAPPGTPPEALAKALGGNPQLPLAEVGDAAKLQAAKPEMVMASEFEWRDKARLGDAQWQQLEAALRDGYVLKESFATVRVVPELPGRGFVPHDFLYTHPEVRVWGRS